MKIQVFPVKKREISLPLTSYFTLIGKGCHFNCHATACEQTCVLGGCSLVCHGKYCNQACQGGYCKLECPSDTKECKQSCGPGQPCSKVIAKLPTPTPYSPAECSSVVNGVCKQFCSTDSCDMKCFNSPYYHSCELSCTGMYLITFIYQKYVLARGRRAVKRQGWKGGREIEYLCCVTGEGGFQRPLTFSWSKFELSTQALKWIWAAVVKKG